MLQTYTVNSSGITLNTGDAVPFNINDISTCCNIKHSAGTPTIEIRRRGYYKVTFSSFGYNTGAVVAGTPYSGMYAFQLNNKGVPIAGAVGATSSTAATDTENVIISYIIYIPPSCAVVNNRAELTVNYLGQVGTVQFANLTVEKLG